MQLVLNQISFSIWRHNVYIFFSFLRIGSSGNMISSCYGFLENVFCNCRRQLHVNTWILRNIPIDFWLSTMLGSREMKDDDFAHLFWSLQISLIHFVKSTSSRRTVQISEKIRLKLKIPIKTDHSQWPFKVAASQKKMCH